MNLTTEERIELIELLGRYGRLIDARDWEALGGIFTPDAQFDLTAIGGSVLNGLDEIRDYMANRARHPVAHHITNPHVDRIDDDNVWLSCMLVAVQADGSVASGHYADQVVRYDGGLRIRRRQFRWLLAPRPKAPS
jgi:SnoaL-like domain